MQSKICNLRSATGAPDEPPPPLTRRAARTPVPGRGAWLTLLCLNLLGYALLGKGWAYFGVPPLYIGEAILLCGVVWFILFGGWRHILDITAVWFLLLLQAWGTYRTLPYLSRYGADALRDAVIWGYSAFALIVLAAILAQPRRLVALLNSYKRFALIFLICIPAIWLAARVFLLPVIPHLPWANLEHPISPKAGDIMVHLAGILAFWVAGLGGLIGPVRVLLLTGSVVLLGTFDRAGSVSFLAVFAFCSILRPGDRTLWRVIKFGICGVLLFAATNVRVPMPGRDREVSFAQMVANLASTVSFSSKGDLDDTKQWRLEWWTDILNYTVNGRYCWDGKGFGINLADEDGYQVEEDGSLREPHNGHLTMLARGGVPGFIMWVLVQLSWAWGLMNGYFRSQNEGARPWTSVFLFLLAYWMAFMINTTFDVFLEGPMGGIWFWTVYGVGLAAIWLYKHNPAVLDGVLCEGKLSP